MADEFIDQGPGQAGTTIGQANLDALVVAASYLKSGGIPATSASLQVAQPAAEIVVNRNDGTALFVAIAATTLTLTASSDNYIDATTAGAYTITAVAAGSAAPAQAAQTLRLYKATTGASAVTAAPVQLATSAPVAGAMVQTGTPNGVAGLDSGARLPVGQLPSTITVGGKLTLPTRNYSNVAGGGGVVAVDAALSGNVPVNNGIANGTTWQINTTAATAGSTVVVTPACGAITNMAFVVQSNPGGGSFNVMLNTTNGAALNAAGAFYWAIVSSL